MYLDAYFLLYQFYFFSCSLGNKIYFIYSVCHQCMYSFIVCWIQRTECKRKKKTWSLPLRILESRRNMCKQPTKMISSNIYRKYSVNIKISGWVEEGWREVTDISNMKKLSELLFKRWAEILQVKKGMWVWTYLGERNEVGERGESCSLLVIHTVY